jgi:hypothetical protein
MKTTTTTINSLESTLKMAKDGLDDIFKGKKERVHVGLLNLTVWGRAVTNVLQNLRSTEKEFDDWYMPYQKEMMNDELMKYFYKRRSEHLKQGNQGIITSLSNINFDSSEVFKKYPPPKNNKGFFIGRGMGWKVELADGSIENIYVEAPKEWATINLDLINPPKTHLNQEVTDISIENLSSLYYSYLKNLVQEATKKFSSRTNS